MRRVIRILFWTACLFFAAFIVSLVWVIEVTP